MALALYGSNVRAVIVTTPFLGECAFVLLLFFLHLSRPTTGGSVPIRSPTNVISSYREIILYRDGAVTTTATRFDRDSRTFILLKNPSRIDSTPRHATRVCLGRLPRLASIALLRSTAIYRHDLTRHELMPTSCFARL